MQSTTDLRPFNALTKQEQSGAISALDKAGDLACEGGADEKRVREILRRHTSDLALDDKGHAWLLVETPEFRHKPVGAEYIPVWVRSEMLIGGTGPEAVPGPDVARAILWHFLGTNVQIVPMALGPAISLLASDQSPAAFLTEMREKLAELRLRQRRESEKAQRMARAQKEEDERYERDNRVRVAKWNQTPREAQLLYVVADRLPEYAPLLTTLVDVIVKNKDPRYGVKMPRAWRLQELSPAQWALEFVHSAPAAELPAAAKPDAAPASTPAAEVLS